MKETGTQDVNEATIFTALADPTRRELLVNLAQGTPKTATELAKEYPISRPGLIKHLNILQEAGLVRIDQQGRDKRYVFTPEPLSKLEQWIEEVTHTWEGNLLRIKTMIESETPEE